MKSSTTKTIITHTIQAIWSVLVILIFIVYSGRISHITGSSFNNWDIFFQKLAVIDFPFFVKSLFLAFIAILGFTISCIALGSVFTLNLWQKQRLSIIAWSSNLISAFLIGEIIYSFTLLILGITGKLSTLATTTVLIVGFLAGAVNAKTIFLSYSNRIKEEANNTKTENVILWLSIAIVLSASMLSTARLSYDSVALYFSNAKLIATSHQIQSFLNDSFVVSSFHIGILQTSIIQLFGDQAARLYSWLNGVFIIAMCIGITEKFSLARAGKIITLVLFVTSTAFLDLFGDGKIELASTLPIIAAIYWLISANKTEHIQDYLFVGIFSGFAMIARPYNIILLGGFIGIYYIFSKESLISRVKTLSWIAVPITILLAAHLILNWIILGDPLAPINNTLRVDTNIWQWSFDPNQIWIIRIFYPLVATFINTAQSLGNISPLILIFLPALLLKENRTNTNFSKSLMKVVSIAVATLTLWITAYFTVLEIRYVFFLWAIIYIAFAERISTGLRNMDSTSKNIAQGIIISLLLFIFTRNLFITIDAYAPINKNGIPQCGDFIFCDFLVPVNEMAKPGERVLALNAYRYYLRPELFACSSKNTEYVEIKEAAMVSNEAFWLEVHRQGYTFITYERNYAVRHLYMDFLPTPQNLPSWVHLKKLEGDANGSFVSYKINYINPPREAEKECVRVNNIWLVQDIH